MHAELTQTHRKLIRQIAIQGFDLAALAGLHDALARGCGVDGKPCRITLNDAAEVASLIGRMPAGWFDARMVEMVRFVQIGSLDFDLLDQMAEHGLIAVMKQYREQATRS